MAKIKSIAVFDIKTNGENPRQVFDKTALDGLRASIKASGLHSPLIVAPDKKGYKLVDGERRLLCLKQLGFKRVEAVVQEGDEEQLREMRLTINLQREGLHPMDEAAGYKRLQREYSYTVPQLALKLGRSQGYVVPESFTHGTSEQRMSWLKRGIDTGSISACDTFS